MALLGIPPEIFGMAATAVLFYQFWVHTEHIGKLGWFDLIFTSPSNHRVHHAINDRYIDKNYGAILIIWDRMFGTFEPENEACIYGTLTPLNSWNPIIALSSVFQDMGNNVIHASAWADKARFIYKNPGWSPSSSENSVTKSDCQIKYDPPVTDSKRIVAVSLFMIASTETFMLMWNEEDLGLPQKLMATILIAVTLWIAGRIISKNK